MAGSIIGHSEMPYHPHEIKVQGLTRILEFFTQHQKARHTLYFQVRDLIVVDVGLVFFFSINPLKTGIGGTERQDVWQKPQHHLTFFTVISRVPVTTSSSPGDNFLVRHLCTQGQVSYVDHC